MHLHIGDYVNYEPGENGIYVSEPQRSGTKDYFILNEEEKTQTFEIAPTTWRVFGTEGEGENRHILLISGETIKRNSESENNLYCLYGAEGYEYGPDELNNISALYGKGKGATGARSVNINDINKICGVIIGEEGIQPEGINKFDNYGKTVSYKDKYETPKDYLENIKSDFSATSNMYYYTIDDIKINNRIKNMVFPNNSMEVYWLATNFKYVGKEDVYFTLGMVNNYQVNSLTSLFLSFGDEHRLYGGIRPIVELENNVTNSVLHKIDDPINDEF